MKITYQNGTVRDALLLSHGEDGLRAALPGDDDVRTFHRADGVWLSEECEPVTIEFAWQRTRVPEAPIEDDCVCSKRLASRLISLFLSGAGQEEPGANLLYVFSADGSRVRIHQSQLGIQ
jgi:hypothetical protein